MEKQFSTPDEAKFKLGDLVRASSCLANSAYTEWCEASDSPFYSRRLRYDIRLKLTNTDIGIVSFVRRPRLSAGRGLERRSNYYKVHFLQSNITIFLSERQLKRAKQEKAIMFD